VASAVVLATAHMAWGWGGLSFLGLVPLCLVVNPTRFLGTWAALALFNALYTALTLSWICIMGGGFVWVLLAAALYGTPFLALPAAGCWLVRSPSSRVASLLVLPAGWALAEVGARHAGFLVTWALLGLPLADWPVLAQSAAVGGPETLSYLVVAINVAFALTVRGCPKSVKILGLLQGPGLLLLAATWGLLRLSADHPPGPSLRVGVIQPNIQQARKWDPAHRQSTLAQLDHLIAQAIDQDPAILVLPETAVTGFVRYENDLTAWVKGTVRRWRRPLVFGSLDRTADASQFFNVAIMITPYNTVTTYRKVRLVPMTEYVPELGPLRRLLSGLRGGLSEITPGAERTLFKLKAGITFATLICYEDIFPDLARDFASAGAEALIALVNTERFKDSSQAWQHLRRARLTAIAVGRPLVRCTNSGISCVIDGKGRLLATLRAEDGRVLLIAGARVFSVPLEPLETIYRRCGDALPVAVLTLLVTGCAAGTRLGRTRSA
jgi:apolipoprotein N-acyltransferase